MNLTEKNLRLFESLLLKLKMQLQEAGETGQQAEEIVELDQARVGRLSRMDALQAQAMSQETGRRRQQQLVKIDAALERVSAGEFGACLECGEGIHPGRLQADPTATLCIACAEAHE